MNLYEGVAKYYDIEESEYQQEDMDFYIEYAQKCKGNILELMWNWKSEPTACIFGI